jgi:hypothetical protein
MKNDYEIRGNITAIFLRKKDGTVFETLIDTNDLTKVKEFPYTWFVCWNKTTKSFYARGNSPRVNGKSSSVFIHRWILNVSKGLVADHINHDTLNNTRANLRVLTQSENLQNYKGAYNDSKTGIRGVSWHKEHKKYRAILNIDKKQIHLGYYQTIEEAERVVINARKELMPFSKEVM